MKKISEPLLLDNILLKSDDLSHLLLADFGLSRFSADALKTTCGTPTYIAPEILQSDCGYGKEVDMWAVGVMSYVMLCGYPPFTANALGRLYYLIMKSEFTFKVY